MEMEISYRDSVVFPFYLNLPLDVGPWLSNLV